MMKRMLRILPMGIRSGEDALKLWPCRRRGRSEEHTSELQSLMRISYAVFCLNKKTRVKNPRQISQNILINSMPLDLCAQNIVQPIAVAPDTLSGNHLCS